MTHTNQPPTLLLPLQEERDSDIARDDSDALTLCTIHQVREASEYLLGARVAKGRDWPNPNPNPNPNQAKGREWPVVFVPNLVEGELPLEGAEIEEVRIVVRKV